MPAVFRFELNDLPPEAESLRAEVREFLRKEFSGTAPVKRASSRVAWARAAGSA